MTEEERKIYDSFIPPDGWKEVFPFSPMNFKIFDIKDENGNQTKGSQMIIFEGGYGHCLMKL